MIGTTSSPSATARFASGAEVVLYVDDEERVGSLKITSHLRQYDTVSCYADEFCGVLWLTTRSLRMI